MLNISPSIPVYLCRGATDMRAGFDRLAFLIESSTDRRVLQGGLFVFFNRRRERVKILYFDRDGYAMWYKRLEVGKFLVRHEEDWKECDGKVLQELLSGVDLSRIEFRKSKENILFSSAK